MIVFLSIKIITFHKIFERFLFQSFRPDKEKKKYVPEIPKFKTMSHQQRRKLKGAYLSKDRKFTIYIFEKNNKLCIQLNGQKEIFQIWAKSDDSFYLRCMV